jgi:hypothetical protein
VRQKQRDVPSLEKYGPVMKTAGKNGQVMTSLRVMEFELPGTCWKSLLKASQEVRRDSTTGDYIWGRTSPGERVSGCN